MPKLINSYSADGSLADAFSAFANSFGQNTPQKELARQKAYGLSRENENLPLLAEAIVAGNYDAATRHGILSGIDPKNTAGYGQYQNVNRYGPTSEQALRATMAVPGAKYNNTVQGVNAELGNKRTIAQMTTDRTLAHDRWKTENTPNLYWDEQGVARTTSQGDAIRRNLPGVVNETQLKAGLAQRRQAGWTPAQTDSYVGANPAYDIYNADTPSGTIPVQVRPDGVYHADRPDKRVEQPISNLSKLVATKADDMTGNASLDKDIINNEISAKQAVAGIDRLSTALAAPDAALSRGYVGSIASVVNDVRSQLEAIGGFSREQALTVPGSTNAVATATATVMNNPQLFKRLQELGINREVLQSQITDLTYVIAKSNGQEGRGLSNQDANHAAQMLGAAIMDPASGRAVLADLRARVENNFRIRQEVLQARKKVQPAALPAAPGAGQQSAAPRQAPITLPPGVPPPEQRPVGFQYNGATWNGQGWVR